MNRKILEKNIYLYENVLENPELLIKDIELLDSIPDETSITKWADWTAYQSDYSFGEQKKIKDSIFDDSLPYYLSDLSIYNRINDSIHKASNDYAEMHNNMNIGVLTPFSISKYFVGKYMGTHVDSYGDDESRTISVILYLNNNYEGGEINFPEQKILLKPKAGSVLVFPSKTPYFHESKEIISGIKYMAPGSWQIGYL